MIVTWYLLFGQKSYLDRNWFEAPGSDFGC